MRGPICYNGMRGTKGNEKKERLTMKVTQKKIEDGKVRLEASVTAEEVNNALQAAHSGFADTMGLAPQKDKTVAQAAEESMGIKNLDSVVESSAIDALVPLALDKKNIVPSFPPKAEPKTPFKRDRPFTFTMDVTLKPEYELKSYDPVEITVEPFKFDESSVDEQLAEMANRYTTYEADDPKPVEKGDSCLLAMKCFENGEEIQGLTSDGRTFVAGEGYMPEGFEENILGMQPGETKSFTFEGPGVDEEYNEITQVIDCTVTVKEIQKAVVPEINDEWIKTNMPMYKDLADLRQNIKTSLKTRERENYENYKRQLAASELARRFEGEIADEVYEATRANILNDIRTNLQQQGKSWDDFLEENGGEQQFGMLLMLQSRDILVQGYSLDAVFRHEHLTIADEDIEAACRVMNPQSNPKATRQQLEQSGRGFVLRESAERMKANQWVLDHAIVKRAKHAEPESEEAPASEQNQEAEAASDDASAQEPAPEQEAMPVSGDEAKDASEAKPSSKAETETGAADDSEASSEPEAEDGPKSE